MNIQPSVTEYKPLSVPDDALKLEVAFCVQGVLSPLLSNIVLDELDQEMARRGYRFVRYADDANIYVQSPRAGQRVMASISRFIERRPRLKVNTTKSTVTKPERSHFLGFRLPRQSTDGTVAVMLSKRSVDRIYEAIRSKTPRSWGQSLDACIEDLNRYLRGWIGFFRIVTPAAFTTLSDLDAHIRRRLRAIVLRHWRRKRVIIRRLIRRRVPESLVRRAVLNGRRSWWALSHTAAVDRGLSTRFFQSRGLFSLVAFWRAEQAALAATVTAPTQFSLLWE
jgi:RNA-directed DNA polymerase